MSKFEIRKVVLRPGEITRTRHLGYIEARWPSGALLKAFKRWPGECDTSQVQAGFYTVKVSKE